MSNFPSETLSEWDVMVGSQYPYGNISWTTGSTIAEPIYSKAMQTDRFIDSDYIVIPKQLFKYLSQRHIVTLLHTFDSVSTISPEITDNVLKSNADNLESEVEQLYRLAENITFEEGMVNEYSLRLEQLINLHGNTALKRIEMVILNEKTSTTISMETLRYIGDFDTDKWRKERRTLLENCLLKSQLAWIRDGAALGLSYMDDPKSIPVLKEAISNESNKELKEDMILVLEQLEDTRKES